MPPTKPQIHSLFPTPLCVHYLPVAVEVNTALRPLILERTQGERATAQGTPVPEDFRLWGNHHAETLCTVVTDMADSMTA